MTGSVRRRASGRWQARVFDRATGKHVSLGTYDTKAAAKAALRRALVDQERGQFVPPGRGREKLGAYIAQWIDSNPRITSPRTRELYQGLLRRHIEPQLGQASLSSITPTTVRRWHSALAATSPSTAAKAYRLLRAVLNTAVADELILRNPCRVEGAGIERSAERPIATVAEVWQLADAVEPRYRAMVLLAAFCSLRLGELAALTRADLDLLHRRVHVRRNRQRLDDGTSVVIEPKSAAGRRTVAIPPPLVPDLERHLDTYAEPGADGLVFVGEKGAPIDRWQWNRRWQKARQQVGRPDLRFHDLRHTGNTLAAATGASTRELMARMGHASVRAALIYQHATADRDQAIADALGEIIQPAPVVDLDHARQVDRRSP